MVGGPGGGQSRPACGESAGWAFGRQSLRAARNPAKAGCATPKPGRSSAWQGLSGALGEKTGNAHMGFSRRNGPITSASSPLPKKQRIASAGVLTIGSPATLNDVFKTAGTPVASAKDEIRR